MPSGGANGGRPSPRAEPLGSGPSPAYCCHRPDAARSSASFLASAAYRTAYSASSTAILEFTEEDGELLEAVVFFIFGIAAPEFVGSVTWEIALFALLSLAVIRMAPVAIASFGTAFSARSVIFIGWFGPRGLTSIILALVVLEEQPRLPGIDFVLAAMTLKVLASINVHGATARPFARAYGRHCADLGPDAPEKGTYLDFRARGRTTGR